MPTQRTRYLVAPMLLCALGLLGACFEPTYPRGQPCSETDRCPPDQRCTEGVCRFDPSPQPPGDAMPSDGGPGSAGVVLDIALGTRHTCVLLEGGAVRCWGQGADGRLGYGNTMDVGAAPTLLPRDVGDVELDGPVQKLALGDRHTCALLENGLVHCWGSNELGQIGSGVPKDIVGDDETPAEHLPVRLDMSAVDLASYMNHTCAVLSDSRSVQCWGQGGPQLGQSGDGTQHVGDDETPLGTGITTVPDTIVAIDTGVVHTCVLTQGGAVYCWGQGVHGRLGQGDILDISTIPEAPVALGEQAQAMDVGAAHTCVTLPDGALTCWGRGDNGRLGYGNIEHVGDDAGDTFQRITVGGSVSQVVAGGPHTCALLAQGELRCWGAAAAGRLGQAQVSESYGDDELASASPPTPVVNASAGEAVKDMAAHQSHTCVVISVEQDGEPDRVRCFGAGASGALGYGNIDDVGDDETPLGAGDVPLF